MPHFSKGTPYKPSENHDDRKPIDKNADCLKCMSGHSMFKKEKETKKKTLKDKDLFVVKSNKKSVNIIKNKKKNYASNNKKNPRKQTKLKTGKLKDIHHKIAEINGSAERKARKFNRFIGKYTGNHARNK